MVPFVNLSSVLPHQLMSQPAMHPISCEVYNAAYVLRDQPMYPVTKEGSSSAIPRSNQTLCNTGVSTRM